VRGGRLLGMTLPENLERVLPEIGRDLFDVLVIRTDFSDDEAWEAVVGELHRPWGPGGEFAAAVHWPMRLLGQEQRPTRFLPPWRMRT
jgi:hypothetical protein